MTLIKQVLNDLTVNHVKVGLLSSPAWQRKVEGETDLWTDGQSFRNVTLAYANEMGWSVNKIVDHYLTINGCK